MLGRGRIRVGLVYSHVRETQRPTRCFRCLEQGHESKSCNGVDRSKDSWRCRKTGHFRKDCAANAQEAKTFKDELEHGCPNGTSGSTKKSMQ